MNKYLMDKNDFTFSGYSELVEKAGKHSVVNHEQMMFVLKNPKTNGPKLLRFLLTSDGTPDMVKEAAWADIIRGEQKKLDDAAAAPAATVSAPVASPDAGDPYADTRKMLDGMEDKKELVKYVTKTLGLVVDERCGKAKIIEQAIDALRQMSKEVG